MSTVVAAVAVAAVVLGLVLFFASRAGHRTWTEEEFERERHSGSAVGNAFLSFQAIFDPGAQHALEQRNADGAEAIESGAPPDPSKPT
jgi:hypothetical protein